VGDRCEVRSVDARWQGSGAGKLNDLDRSVWATRVQRLDFPNISLSSLEGAWSIAAVHPLSSTINGVVDIVWSSMLYRSSFEAVAATVVYVTKAPPIVYPDRLPIVEGVFGRSTGENALRTQLFGRDALLRSRTIDGVPHFVVAYVGEPMHEQMLTSFLSVIDLLFGQEHELLHEDAVDGCGSLVRRRLWSHRAADDRPRSPAILCDSHATTQQLGLSLPTMVKRSRQLRFIDDAPIDVAVKYLLRFNGGQLDLEIRDITSALNAMIESPAYGPRPESILPKRQFRRLRKAVSRAIGDLSVDMPDRLRRNFVNGLNGANDISPLEHRRRFYDAVGFTPSSEEQLALRRRHVMAHLGSSTPNILWKSAL